MTDDPLETRIAEALQAARADARLTVRPWADAPERIRRAAGRRRRHHASIAATVTAALVLGALGAGKLYLDRTLSRVQTAATLPAIPTAPGIATGTGHLVHRAGTTQAFTVLVLGTDSRVGTGTEYGTNADACGCSDTIMLARVDPQTAKVSLLSIPRDTRVQLASYDRVGKLNAAFGRGPDNTVSTVEKALNIDINHWVVLDLAGFKQVVDAVGGVQLQIPVPIRDKNAGLDLETTGCRTLTGDQALAVSRARELQYLDSKGKWTYDPTYENGRQRREQMMVRVLAAQTARSGLSNPLTAAKVVSTFTSNHRLAVDNQFTTDELVDLAGAFAGFDAAGMQTFSLPTYTASVYDATVGKNLEFEILEAAKDVATIQAWYDAVQPASSHSAVSTPATAPPRPTLPSTAAPLSVPATQADPTKAVSPAGTAISPNQPQPWDPQPCS